MGSPTRRNFLKDLGWGTAAFSLPAGQGRPMPGRPASGGATTPGPVRIMAIAAHPGDVFFAMGAPVALEVHAGGEGVLLSLSLGEKGSATIAPARYGAMQRNASERGARLLGAQAVFLAYPDGEIPANDEAKFAVCDLIREYKPDVVITHWRGSWHKDHRACYRIVTDAIFYAALPAIARSRPPHAVRNLFFADNWEDAAGFNGDTYLDVSPVFSRWQQACAVFPMWRGQTGFRYDDYYRSRAVGMGCVAGFNYAVTLMLPPEQLVRRQRTL
jgi:N-acetylglucosamine malate deacetylase 1